MSLIDTARDALKDLPISDIVRERLSLALDRLSDAETKIGELQIQVGSEKATFERERLDHQKTLLELQRLKDEYSEEIRIHSAIEFRRGKRTGGQWMPFCPKCRMPGLIDDDEEFSIMCSANCGWTTSVFKRQLAGIISQL